MGSGVYGWALLDDVPVWYELWRQINGFPPDYVGDATAYPAGQPTKNAKPAKAEKSTGYGTEE